MKNKIATVPSPPICAEKYEHGGYYRSDADAVQTVRYLGANMIDNLARVIYSKWTMTDLLKVITFFLCDVGVSRGNAG